MPVNFIKRLIGLPGDTIEAHAGVIFVGGVPNTTIADIREQICMPQDSLVPTRPI